MDALRGYGFQIYGSVLAWTNLDEEDVLHLELVEDYATATADALHATQAKDTRGSGSVTLNTPGVIQAIEALVDLAERNPERAVHLRYMTTSPIGPEASPGDRIEGEPGLAYWGRVAAGHADPGPLVRRLRAMPLKRRTKALLAMHDDDALVSRLVSRLHWDCGRGGIDAIRLQIEARLTRTGGVHGQQVQAAEAGRVIGALVEHAFRTATQAGSRALTTADLRRAVQDATHVALPRGQLTNLLGALELLGHQGTVAFAPSRLPSWIDRVDDLPPPRRNLERPVLADAIARALGRRERVGVLFGATGVGKTLLARSAATATGGGWHSVDLLTEGASEAVERLRNLLGRIDDVGAGGLIIEDFDASEIPAAVRALSALVAIMRRDGRLCLVTTHREPSPGMLDAVGTGRDASIQVHHLDEREAGRLAVLGGGSESLGGLIWLASAGGHPRLAQAVVADLEARGWSRDALDEYLGGETPRELRRERADARKRLLATVRDEDARVMLYRASLVLGRFNRRTAFALGSVDPRTRQPGETLDRLVGPWIDEVGPDQFRVSPLLGDAGERSLSEDEQRRTHAAVAGAIMAEGAISVSQADALLFHGLRGKLVTAILALASGLLGADPDQKRMLAEWSHVLRCLPTDALPYPDNPSLSLVLRVAQFEALVIRGTDEELSRCVHALLREVPTARGVEGGPPMEAAVLAQVLTERRTGAILVDQWPDLLVRLAALVDGDDAFAQKFDSRLTLLGMIFSVHAHAAADVAGLEALFDRIDWMDAAGRSVLVRASDEAVEGLDLILRHPLFEDVKRGMSAWREAADRYARMAGRARAWGASELALRCLATRAVAIAEVGREPEKALQSLDEAERDLGPDLVLTRERGKILGRRGDHAGALPLLTRCMDDNRNGAYERAVLAREVALSAAGLGQHASARDRFDDVRRIATTVGTPLSHMAVGSMADAAVSEVKLGHRREALTRLADCLERLDELGSPSDLKSAYVHHLVRHAVLWTFAELSGTNAAAPGDRIRIDPRKKLPQWRVVRMCR